MSMRGNNLHASWPTQKTAIYHKKSLLCCGNRPFPTLYGNAILLSVLHAKSNWSIFRLEIRLYTAAEADKHFDDTSAEFQ